MVVGAGVLGDATARLWGLVRGRRVFAVSSARIVKLHGEILDRLGTTAAHFETLEVVDGEKAKSVEVAADLWRRLLLAGGKRDSLIVAFGGGSIGDLAGFVAGCFLRGVDLIQIPTTLLAQVDAAIGGKTAINLPQAKNSVGVFHHPLATVADTRLLTTLAPRQLRSGLFEVVKTGAVLDAGLLDDLEVRLGDVIEANPEALAPIVARTAAAKIAIVEEDPEEAGRRKLLNFGHTLGHALEMTSGTLEHGEAVGYGMLFALDLAHERGLGAEAAARVRRLIYSLGLPALPPDLNLDNVLGHLQRDKKAREGGVSWVLPESLGVGGVFDDVDLTDVRRRLPGFVATASTPAADC